MLAGTSTSIEIETVRELGAGVVVVDGTQTLTGPIPPMHVTAVVRQHDGTAEILECRPVRLSPRALNCLPAMQVSDLIEVDDAHPCKGHSHVVVGGAFVPDALRFAVNHDVPPQDVADRKTGRRRELL